MCLFLISNVNHNVYDIYYIVGQDRETFNRPASVAVAQNGDIFVADGEGPNNRIVKYTAEGRYIMEWGTTGSGPGQFSTPHDLAIDSRGRLHGGHELYCFRFE